MHPELRAYLDDYHARTMARYDAVDKQHALMLKILTGVSTPQPACSMGTAADDSRAPAAVPDVFSATTQAQETPAVAHDAASVCIAMVPITCSIDCSTQVDAIASVDEVQDVVTTVYPERAVTLSHKEVVQLIPVQPTPSIAINTSSSTEVVYSAATATDVDSKAGVQELDALAVNTTPVMSEVDHGIVHIVSSDLTAPTLTRCSAQCAHRDTNLPRYVLHPAATPSWLVLRPQPWPSFWRHHADGNEKWPMPWPSLACSRELYRKHVGLLSQVTSAMNHFSGTLNSLREPGKYLQSLQLKLPWPSFSSNCSAVSVGLELPKCELPDEYCSAIDNFASLVTTTIHVVCSLEHIEHQFSVVLEQGRWKYSEHHVREHAAVGSFPRPDKMPETLQITTILVQWKFLRSTSFAMQFTVEASEWMLAGILCFLLPHAKPPDTYGKCTIILRKMQALLLFRDVVFLQVSCGELISMDKTFSHLHNAMERWAFDISASFHVTELEGISRHIFFAIHTTCLFSWDCCNMELVVTAASQQDQRHYHGRQPDAHYILQLKGSVKHFFEFFLRMFTLMKNLEKNNSEISIICTFASVVHNSNKITCPWVQSEDASTKFGELNSWPQLDYATKSALVQNIEKHLNQSVQRRVRDISAGFSQEELEGISYHGTFAIHTAYLISCLSRPCPWPSFDCFHEGAQLRCTWPKISYVLHHFAGALNSLTESLRCCQGVHLKLLCSSFSSNCQAGDVVSEQYFVNYILILMKIQHRILHSLYFVSKPLQPSAAPFALHATFLPMEVDHTTSTAAWDKCGCQLLILRRTYHFLPDYKWEQSIPQDWEWLLSSAAQRTPLAHLKTVDSSLASPGITAITVDKSMHHGVVPPCASIQAGGDQFKNEWRLLKPNFLQASFGPCSDAYFSGNQCMVVLKLLVHPVGQLNDMIQKWSSQYHAGESSKFTYNYGICFGIPLVESELLLFELELLIPQPGEHFPLLQPKPPWPPLVTPQFSTEFCNNMRTNSEFLHLTGVLWEITRLWTYANHASTGSSYGWCFSWGTYLDTVVLAACPGSSIPQEFQSTTRNQDQYAVQSVQPTTSCEQWDPGGLDPTEPAENEHRLGGKPVVKEEGMSATQKTTKATSSRSATVVAKPAAMAAQVVSPPTDRDQRMGRASLGAIPGSRLTTSNHGKHSEGSSGLGSGKGNGGTLFPLSSPTSVLPPSFS